MVTGSILMVWSQSGEAHGWWEKPGPPPASKMGVWRHLVATPLTSASAVSFPCVSSGHILWSPTPPELENSSPEKLHGSKVATALPKLNGPDRPFQKKYNASQERPKFKDISEINLKTVFFVWLGDFLFVWFGFCILD